MVTPASVGPYTVDFMEHPSELEGRALVVFVDDSTAHAYEEDHSGPLVTELLGEAGFVVDGVVVVSADEVEIRYSTVPIALDQDLDGVDVEAPLEGVVLVIHGWRGSGPSRAAKPSTRFG